MSIVENQSLLQSTSQEESQDFPQRFAGLLHNLGLRQTDIATAIGASRGTVSKWISGDARPSSAYAERIARTLGTTKTWLLYGDDSSQPPASNSSIDNLESHRQVFIDALDLDFNKMYDIEYLYGLYYEHLKKSSAGDKGYVSKMLSELGIKPPSSALDIASSTLLKFPVREFDFGDAERGEFVHTGDEIVVSKDVIKQSGASKKDSFCYYSNDRAMLPTITLNAACLVDSGKLELKSGNIYLLRYGSIVIMRYVFKNHDGSLLLRSANPEHADIVLLKDDLFQLFVLGWVFSYTHIMQW